MNTLQHRQQKIQNKRKQTPFREFLLEIASWMPLTLHKIDGKISRYPDTSRIANLMSWPQFELERDGFDAYGKDFDGSQSVFTQLQQLYKEVPKYYSFQMRWGDNTEFADVVRWSKNVYLSYFTVFESENVFYSMIVREKCVNIYNSVMVFKQCENVYESSWITESFNIFHSRYIKNSSNIWFSNNLIWCHNCFGCAHLEQQSYCIFNEQYSKEDYQTKVAQLRKEHHNYPQRIKATYWPGTNMGSNSVTWDFIIDSNNVENWLFSYNCTDARNVVFCWGEHGDEDFCDVFVWWAWQAKHFYAVQWSGNSEHIYCSNLALGNNLYYSHTMEDCSYCFGCMWLKNKHYHIFNKPYTKDERHQKVDEICTQMDNEWILGDFFPWFINPFYFNDTAAYLIDPSFTKEEATAQWYLRRDKPITVDIPEGVQTVHVNELGKFESTDSLWKHSISDDILRKVIVDDNWNAYRIIPMELEFLSKHGLPLPRLHRLDRMKQHFAMS